MSAARWWRAFRWSSLPYFAGAFAMEVALWGGHDPPPGENWWPFRIAVAAWLLFCLVVADRALMWWDRRR